MDERNPNEYYEDEIDLMELFAVLWRRKWLIVGIVLLCTVVAWGWSSRQVSTVTEELVQLNFDGIDKHQYPDESQFDIYDLIAPDVLAQAAYAIEDETQRETFRHNPRGYVFIDPFIPPEVQGRIDALAKKGETYIYLPGQFFLRFEEGGKGAFSPDERKKLLLAVADVYGDKFAERYVKRQLLALDLEGNELKGHDYLDMIDIMDQRVASYLAFLEDRTSEAGYYRSSETGQSFADIENGLKNIHDISLAEIESICRTSSITRQKENMRRRYEMKIKEMERRRLKKQQESAIARELLHDVLSKDNGVVAAASGEQQPSMMVADMGVLDKLSEREYVTMLLTRALDAGVEANDLAVDKKYIEDDLAALRKERPLDDTYSAAFVEERLAALQQQIMRLGSEANALNQEYQSKKYSNAVQILKQPQTSHVYANNVQKVTLLSLVVSLMLAMFLAFMVEFVGNRRKEN